MDASGATHKREREVLDAARQVFWQKGYAGTTIADIAERVGVLKGSLYYYVDSKEDLLMRIIQTAHDEAVEILTELTASELPALDRLFLFAERYVLWTLENLESVGLYFREWGNLTGDRRLKAEHQRKEFERFVRDLVRDAQRDGTASLDQDPQTTMFFILGSINSVWTWYRPQGPLRPDEVARRYGASAVAVATSTTYAARQD